MERLRNWLIRKLGGVPREECDRMIRPCRSAANPPLHPKMLKAAYSYYVHPDTDEVRRAQEQMARNELAKKIAFEMLENGMIRVINTVDPLQDRGPIKKYRMTATVWALDAAQMPCYGGDGLWRCFCASSAFSPVRFSGR